MTPRILGAVLVAAMALAAPLPLAAQEGGPATTTATSQPPTTATTLDSAAPTTTATTVDPGASPAPDPDATTTTTSSTVPDPAAGSDAPAEEAPPVDVTVPPPPPPPGVLSDEAVAAARARQASRVVFRNLRGAQRLATEAADALALARLHAADTRRAVGALQRRLGTLRRHHRVAIERLDEAKTTLSDRAAWAYMRGPLHEMTSVLGAEDPNEMYRRMGMVKSVLDADHDAIEEYRLAKEALGEDLAHVVEELDVARASLAEADAQVWEAAERVETTQYELAIVTAGSEIVIHGFVFPVADPHLFVDTFLAPRMPGTEHEHLHQGTDIFAPAGTPLVACERGVITKMGGDVLGGIKLWLVGESGARYYYAHLSAFAVGIHDGMVVEPGTVIGFVGNTGNAVGTPSHLHFEVHPDGGPAVNPFPLLKAVDELD